MKIEFNDLSELKAISNIPDFDNQYEEGKKEITELFKDKNYTLLLVAITGSTSYGLTVEGSDLDFKGIYVENLDNILSEFKLGQTKPVIYQNQISNESNDIVFYELGRILELLQTNNPNSLELLATPDDCICYKHPIWDEIIKSLNENNILTKKCYYTFKQYAYTQIKKATGLNRKINTPVDKKRKTPLDFCNVIFDDDSTMSLRPYLEKNKMDQRLCGLVKVPHAKDLFSLYYDKISDISFSKYINEDIKNNNRIERKNNNDFMGLGYKGIIKENKDDEEVSNEIRLSSVPKEETKICSLSYNKDGYMVYCKSYKEYWGDNGWMNKRNEERYNDNIKSNQNYDGKNLSHCLRLLYMAKEISENKGIIVRRTSEQRNELLDIKKGKLLYEDIIEKCEYLVDGLEENYKNSSLPDEVPNKLISDILLKYRKEIYKI